MERFQHFFENLKGKKIALCGIGISNTPLVYKFLEKGAAVTLCDRRSMSEIGSVVNDLEKAGAKFKLGANYLKDIDADIILRTPGMNFLLPELEMYRQKGIAVTSETELFFDLCPCKIIAVTGSNGKTTTTTIISEFLKAQGYTVWLGGNIGRALLPLIDDIKDHDVAVVELSSFQLISMRQSPDIAVITNISPNHLDVHKNMDEYLNAKKNIFLHQNAFSKTILNADNEITAGFLSEIRGQAFTFSRKKIPDYGSFIDQSGEIYISNGAEKTHIMNRKSIKIPGNHNVENYLAAISAVWDMVSVENMCRVAEEFQGVEHRAEFVREKDGVRYFNDSIATSPSRTIQGTLSLYDRKIILIAGGYDKKIPFDELGKKITEKVRLLILMGNTADKIESSVRNCISYMGKPEIIRVKSMEQAVKTAHLHAQSGDIVSLSPACASFDMYPSFEERGMHFKNIVNNL